MPGSNMVIYEGGVAMYRLEPVHPAAAPVPVHGRVPAARALQLQISDGCLPTHPSKAQVTRGELQSYMWSVQTALGLATGVRGQWNEAAETRLHAWLLKKPVRSKKAAPLASSSDSSGSSSSSSSSDEEGGNIPEQSVIGGLEDELAATSEQLEASGLELEASELENDNLRLQLQRLTRENGCLKRRICELEE
jgi:hypothetical protein